MSNFSTELAKLVANEMRAANGDPEKIADMTERLIASLAFTIAIGTRGNNAKASELLEGCIAHLTETLTAHGNVAAALFGSSP